MRLDRLEISGFKSFPDRADLVFDRGVTAIVGPNGCGKSNVVDAITWVLGEQSAKSLRGERMEDVIFTGSDARKPTATAEVRLRLSGVATQALRQAVERQDGEDVAASGDGIGDQPEQIELPSTELRDVEIARRLYRSGESEYLLDGEVVRLRDVQDLLMDAGLGVKGYAVIEQGKIGQILSAKPTERRTLIEEAAGVTKYKTRRRAAELKLDAAQQNLTRIEDIIFEIDKQRTTLKRQAAKARRYKRLREELRRWEKVLFARRFHVLAQSIDAARARSTEAREREQAAAEALDAIERAVATTRQALTAAEGEASAARARAHACELDKGRHEQQLAFDRQQLAALEASGVTLRADITELEARVEPGRLDLEARREAAARAELERDEAQRTRDAEDEALRTAQHRIDACETDVEAARARVLANINAASALRTAIERATEARERIAAELARLEAEARDLRIETERLAGDREDANESLQAAHAAIDALVTDRNARQAWLSGGRQDRQARQLELRTRERELAALTARIKSLEELDAGREGYGDAAKALLSDASLGLSHRGAVADYLDADPAYERAVEAVLGDVLQAVVVERTEDAQRGLALVRDHNLGRCSFLVASAATSGGAAMPVPLGLRPLSSVVRVSGPYATAIEALVAKVWLAPDFETAASLADVHGQIVTPGGDVFHAGHFVTGGSRTEARGILATKREIKELRDRVADEQLEIERLSTALSALDADIVAAENAVAALAADLHQQEKAVVAHELESRRAGEEIERLARKIEQNQNERRRADEERQRLEERQEEAREAIAGLEMEQREFDDVFAAAQRTLQDARDAAAAQAVKASEAKAAHAALGERALALTTDVGRLEAAARELESRIASRVDELTRTERRREEVTADLAEAERLLEEDVKTFATLSAEVATAEQHVAELTAAFEADDVRVRAARAELDHVRAQAAQLDVARATAEADLVHLAAACQDTLQATLEEVAAEVDELERQGGATPDPAAIYASDETEGDDEADDLDGISEPPAESADAETARVHAAEGLAARAMTAEEAIAKLREKIERLGPVNMMAIEQFDELEQRHTFLAGQRADLVESIASAGEAIKRIEKTTRERFKEAFTAINRYFEEMFTTLFGGGRAGLVLLDENDMLESGIDIIAQPPGKRLQNVQLLSGGEKALTAMALLFAMFRYRPSPFCLLDEIDAPLDDANIGRFLEMLRAMLDRTQFILITHSRKTMEMADRLYGVTMEEPGVSKLISLQLQ